MNKWWGYLHINGTLQHPKRYFGPEDIKEAQESPFVKKVYGPWECMNSDEAISFLEQAYEEDINE